MSSSDFALRQRAQRLLAEHRLPSTTPGRTWAGHGSGEPCALCREAIEPAEYEMEVEYETGAGVRTYIFHRPCHALWDAERLRSDTRGRGGHAEGERPPSA